MLRVLRTELVMDSGHLTLIPTLAVIVYHINDAWLLMAHLRRAVVEANIPRGASLYTARALVEALRAGDKALCLPFVAYRER